MSIKHTLATALWITLSTTAFANFTVQIGTYPQLTFMSCDGLTTQAQGLFEHQASMLGQVPDVASNNQVVCMHGSTMSSEKFWLMDRSMEMQNFSPTTIAIQGPHNIRVTLKNAYPSQIQRTSLSNGGHQLNIQSMIINYQRIYMSVGN